MRPEIFVVCSLIILILLIIILSFHNPFYKIVEPLDDTDDDITVDLNNPNGVTTTSSSSSSPPSPIPTPAAICPFGWIPQYAKQFNPSRSEETVGSVLCIAPVLLSGDTSLTTTGDRMVSIAPLQPVNLGGDSKSYQTDIQNTWTVPLSTKTSQGASVPLYSAPMDGLATLTPYSSTQTVTGPVEDMNTTTTTNYQRNVIFLNPNDSAFASSACEKRNWAIESNLYWAGVTDISAPSDCTLPTSSQFIYAPV